MEGRHGKPFGCGENWAPLKARGMSLGAKMPLAAGKRLDYGWTQETIGKNLCAGSIVRNAGQDALPEKSRKGHDAEKAPDKKEMTLDCGIFLMHPTSQGSFLFCLII